MDAYSRRHLPARTGEFAMIYPEFALGMPLDIQANV